MQSTIKLLAEISRRSAAIKRLKATREALCASGDWNEVYYVDQEIATHDEHVTALAGVLTEGWRGTYG